MAKSKVALVTCSDLHLSLEAPRARAEKGEEWLKVQQRYLRQLHDIKEKHDCEVVYAGDIFNSPYESPELINWAIQFMPKGYGIPGNHELPFHRYEDRHKSAYWTLVKADVIEHLPPNEFRSVRTPGGKFCYLWGFPYGTPVTPREETKNGAGLGTIEGNLDVAIVHAYIWSDRFTRHVKASEDSQVKGWFPKLKGYDVAVFGDNHKGFVSQAPNSVPSILNNGAFIRRSIDEKDYGAVGLVYENGSVERVMLDCSKDKWVAKEEKVTAPEFTSEELEELMRTLRTSKKQRADFAKILLRSIDSERLGRLVKKVILKALDKEQR
jgi:hypothetical protein